MFRFIRCGTGRIFTAQNNCHWRARQSPWFQPICFDVGRDYMLRLGGGRRQRTHGRQMIFVEWPTMTSRWFAFTCSARPPIRPLLESSPRITVAVQQESNAATPISASTSTTKSGAGPYRFLSTLITVNRDSWTTFKFVSSTKLN